MSTSIIKTSDGIKKCSATKIFMNMYKHVHKHSCPNSHMHTERKRGEKGKEKKKKKEKLKKMNEIPFITIFVRSPHRGLYCPANDASFAF